MLKLFRALFYQGLKGTMQLNYACSALYIKQECVKLIITQQKMFAGVTLLNRQVALDNNYSKTVSTPHHTN